MTCQRSVNGNFLMADLRLPMYVHEIRTEVRDDVITGKAESRLSRLAHNFLKAG